MMEVPFISSGATSRAHYALVQKVEYSTSPQLANQHLLAEVESIHHRLKDPILPLEECRKFLIVLLYCQMNLPLDYLSSNMFHFALPYALTLAEAGRTIIEKRIGYLFCAEVMPPSHELQLMLVNTLRKDLEHDSIPRICLALENIVASSNEDLVPAIQSRLHDLVSHDSSHVRRRALFALKSLAHSHAASLSRIGRNVMSRLEDHNVWVASAALSLIGFLATEFPNIQRVVNDIFKVILKNPSRFSPWYLRRILLSLLNLGLYESNIPGLLEIIRSSSKAGDCATLRGAFLLLSTVPHQLLLSASAESPVQSLRPFIISHDPNDTYLFLSCLECVDPILWGGTTLDIPAVLDVREVERIMQLLDSPDTLIRRITLRILNSVDPGVVVSYYIQAVQNTPSGLSIQDLNNYVVRLVNVVELQSGEDGELYARGLQELLLQLDQAFVTTHIILEAVVETTLKHVRYAVETFSIGFATTLLASIVEGSKYSQTEMVIVAALATEYCGRLSICPLDILRGFASRLSSCLPSVKDACLLAMLRVAAECDEVPSQITDSVIALSQNSKRHLRQRCDQFVSLINDKAALADIIRRARSSSLPDFLVALQEPSAHGTPSSPPSTMTSTQHISASKLRYTAYDTPQPAPKLRLREGRSSRLASSSESDIFSDGGRDSLSRASSALSVSSAEMLSRTLTAGELALAANRHELDAVTRPTPPRQHEAPIEHSVEDMRARVDLILLDSPFIPEPSPTLDPEADQEVDFERLWDSFEGGDTRGWYDGSIDTVIRRLQGSGQYRLQVISMDAAPFIGDLKVVVWSPQGQATVRLKESDEDSCLWRVRSMDARLHGEVKGLLA